MVFGDVLAIPISTQVSKQGFEVNWWNIYVSIITTFHAIALFVRDKALFILHNIILNLLTTVVSKYAKLNRLTKSPFTEELIEIWIGQSFGDDICTIFVTHYLCNRSWKLDYVSILPTCEYIDWSKLVVRFESGVISTMIWISIWWFVCTVNLWAKCLVELIMAGRLRNEFLFQMANHNQLRYYYNDCFCDTESVDTPVNV